MKKKNIFNGFLIFVLFFNFIFFSMENVFALSQETVVGPRDRIRKFSELDFKYVPLDTEGKNIDGAGFSCKPEGLKFFESKKITISDFTDGLLAWSYDIIKNVLLFPLLCIGILNAVGNSVSGSSVVSGILVLSTAITSYAMSKLEELIFAEDDYNLDPHNPYCAGVLLTMMAWCLVLTVISKLHIKPLIKFLIIIGINAILYAVKSTFKKLQYDKANEFFNNLSLCGDDWFTYGGDELEQVIDGRRIDSTETKNVWSNYIKTNFPIKGMFLGSYKYKLNKCFKEKNMIFCRNIFNNQSLIFDDINDKTSFSYKQYREFFYGGVEYSYNGCKDPRPERKSYSLTNNSNSQLYYFRGNEAANFACERFLISSTREYREAYECCLDSSQKLICISDNKQKIHVMCDKDSADGKCEISGSYNITENSVSNDRDYCSDLKDILNENESEICPQENKTNDIQQSCPELDEIYYKVCDKNGDIINNKSSEVIESKGTDKLKFKIVKSPHDINGIKYCVETYNLCPYNFRLLGGTEKYGMEFSPSYSYEEVGYDEKSNCTIYDNGKKHCMGPCYYEDDTSACFGKASNFCQIDRHCVVIPKIEKKEIYYTSPYIDDACINNVGSSHNFDNYSPAINASFRSTKLLTAPLVECTVETFKNILMNRAGHTVCIDLNEIPINDDCINSGILYKKGQELTKAGYNSPFKKIKSYLLGLIKAIMALSILLYGYNIVILKKGATPDEFLKFILTMLFVSYFSFSNNWIPYIFDNVYRIYNSVAEFSVEILSENEENSKDPYKDHKYSGCFFLHKNYINNNYDLYGDRSYLAVFDKLDCEFARYIGYSENNINLPSIISIFVLGIFTFGLSILMILPFVLLFMSLIFFIIRIAYIFIVNSLTITILLFLTPIFVPMLLFERTKGMFKSWITKILQSILSPLFIFMSLSMFFVIFNKYYFGDVDFSGTKEPYRDIYCGSICKISNNNIFYISKDGNYEEECNKSNGKIIDLTTSTPICFISQILNKKSDSGNSFLNFLIINSAGVVPVLINFSESVSIFFNIIFLLLIVFLFEQMIGYVNSMTSVIFGSESGGYSGVDDTASGLPTLQQTLGVVANAGAKLSNSLKSVPKMGINKIISNSKERGAEKKIKRRVDQIKYEKIKQDSKNSGKSNDTEVGNKDENK